jgi:ubiquinone/menaquinone biosynthesis C-methylase UbiE/protein-tyrosine-phosphatase
MAEGFLKSFDSRLEVYSAGTNPASKANPNAIMVMNEVGIDISGNKPKNVEMFLFDPFDYVITVCDTAKETCPLFTGHVRHRLHMGFEDPYETTGTFEEIITVYRRIRDEIKDEFLKFYKETIKPETDLEAEGLKTIVKEKYAQIALDSDDKQQSGCCGPSLCCDETTFTIFSEDYTKQPGYNPDADLDLGCGIPTEYAGIREGDHVLDLGSGAGNDCFVARAIVGETGHVSGLDFTDEMIDKARINNKKMGFKNVDFIKGDIEEMPIQDNSFDVIVSNCVLNLVPDKTKAFSEMMRVLKTGGRFCVSDVVIKGSLPNALKEDAVMYAGCVSGALQMEDYLGIIEKKGFKNIMVHKQKPITIPDVTLKKYLKPAELEEFKKGETGIFSITVSASKN